MDVRKFEADLSQLTKRLCAGESTETCSEVEHVKEKLVLLYKQNLVKINHSALELLCAKRLVKEGYQVEVEHRLTKNLVCDVFAIKGDGSLIVEIETGFVPPSHALDPAVYCNARIASKTARYSSFAGKFVLGTTPSNILNIPQLFQEPPRFRKVEEAQKAKELCDIYYSNPPITAEQITYATIHAIYLLDIDFARFGEMPPDAYMQSVALMPFRQEQFWGK